jgi:hypothetical protein
MFTIFFSGEKLAFLDSLPKGQNMDSYYFCSTVLGGVKSGALVVTQKRFSEISISIWTIVKYTIRN